MWIACSRTWGATAEQRAVTDADLQDLDRVVRSRDVEDRAGLPFYSRQPSTKPPSAVRTAQSARIWKKPISMPLGERFTPILFDPEQDPLDRLLPILKYSTELPFYNRERDLTQGP